MNVLRLADEAKTEDEKVALLRNHATPQLKEILKYALHPDVEWLLPPGKPNYKPDPTLVGDEDVLPIESRRLYLFVRGGHQTLEQKRRERLFVNMLEVLTTAEAEFLVRTKDKDFPFKSLTPDVVNEAFPGLLPVKKN